MNRSVKYLSPIGSIIIVIYFQTVDANEHSMDGADNVQGVILRVSMSLYKFTPMFRCKCISLEVHRLKDIESFI